MVTKVNYRNVSSIVSSNVTAIRSYNVTNISFLNISTIQSSSPFTTQQPTHSKNTNNTEEINPTEQSNPTPELTTETISDLVTKVNSLNESSIMNTNVQTNPSVPIDSTKQPTYIQTNSTNIVPGPAISSLAFTSHNFTTANSLTTLTTKQTKINSTITRLSTRTTKKNSTIITISTPKPISTKITKKTKFPCKKSKLLKAILNQLRSSDSDENSSRFSFSDKSNENSESCPCLGNFILLLGKI